MRGISPIFASVLLISLSLFLAMLVGIWAKGFTEAQLSYASRKINCLGAEIERVAFDYDNASKTGYVKIKNWGINLSGFVVYAVDSERNKEEILKMSARIKSGETKTIYFDLSGVENAIAIEVVALPCTDTRIFLSLK